MQVCKTKPDSSCEEGGRNILLLGHYSKLKTADNTVKVFPSFPVIAVLHLRIQLSNRNHFRPLSWKTQSTSTLSPNSYQVTQFLIAGIESFQFFTDDIIKNPSINQCLPKFPNLGSIISWMTQDWFQGLISRESFKGQDTEYYCIFRRGNLAACTEVLHFKCLESVLKAWINYGLIHDGTRQIQWSFCFR